MRESPFVEMVERLLGKGRVIRIFDPNVQLARLIGANKRIPSARLPHIAELIVAEVTDAIDWAETIVVTTTDPVYARAIAAARPDQIVLDLAHLSDASDGNADVLGSLVVRPINRQADGRSILVKTQS